MVRLRVYSPRLGTWTHLELLLQVVRLGGAAEEGLGHGEAILQFRQLGTQVHRLRGRSPRPRRLLGRLCPQRGFKPGASAENRLFFLFEKHDCAIFVKASVR